MIFSSNSDYSENSNPLLEVARFELRNYGQDAALEWMRKRLVDHAQFPPPPEAEWQIHSDKVFQRYIRLYLKGQ